jgi:hypothetical protein
MSLLPPLTLPRWLDGEEVEFPVPVVEMIGQRGMRLEENAPPKLRE